MDIDLSERIRTYVLSTNKPLNFNILRQRDAELHNLLLNDPTKVLPLFYTHINTIHEHNTQSLYTDANSDAAQNVPSLIYQTRPAQSRIFQIEGSLGSFNLTPREVNSKFLNKFVCVRGIVTSMSPIKPKILSSVHYCKELNSFYAKTYSKVPAGNEVRGNHLANLLESLSSSDCYSKFAENSFFEDMTMSKNDDKFNQDENINLCNFTNEIVEVEQIPTDTHMQINSESSVTIDSDTFYAASSFLHPLTTYVPKQFLGRDLTLEKGLTFYADQQIITLQETVEECVAGLIPRTVEVVLFNGMCDCVKPGDRLEIYGVFKAEPGLYKFKGVLVAFNIVVKATTLKNQLSDNPTKEDEKAEANVNSQSEGYSNLIKLLRRFDVFYSVFYGAFKSYLLNKNIEELNILLNKGIVAIKYHIFNSLIHKNMHAAEDKQKEMSKMCNSEAEKKLLSQYFDMSYDAKDIFSIEDLLNSVPLNLMDTAIYNSPFLIKNREEIEFLIFYNSLKKNFLENASKFIAPSIYGYSTVKKAIVLLLLSNGANKNRIHQYKVAFRDSCIQNIDTKNENFDNPVADKFKDNDKNKENNAISHLICNIEESSTGKHFAIKTLTINTRQTINILLVGDPSTAKSQLLRYITNTFTFNTANGRGSSGVGLTALIKNENNEKQIQAGAMVLSDNSTLVIDEFDKINHEDQISLHEAMEQQCVSISKAGMNVTLRARCSVLAAANPQYAIGSVKGKGLSSLAKVSGKVQNADENIDNGKTVRKHGENMGSKNNPKYYGNILRKKQKVSTMIDTEIKDFIDIEESLLSRFDLIFCITDDINEALDRKIALKVMDNHSNEYSSVIDYENEINSHDDNLNVDSLQKASEISSIGNKSVSNIEIIDSENKAFPSMYMENISAILSEDSNSHTKYIDTLDDTLKSNITNFDDYFSKNLETFKKYIKIAQSIQPILSIKAQQQIVKIYSDLRKSKNLNVKVTPRALETIIRMSMSHAKLRLSTIVTENDVAVCKDIMYESMLKNKNINCTNYDNITTKTSSDKKFENIISDIKISQSHNISEKNAMEVNSTIEQKTDTTVVDDDDLTLVTDVLYVLKENNQERFILLEDFVNMISIEKNRVLKVLWDLNDNDIIIFDGNLITFI
ncbi:hypothetical protein EDEG_03850, partial [Edhazardia aedis USNM 41457]